MPLRYRFRAYSEGLVDQICFAVVSDSKYWLSLKVMLFEPSSLRGRMYSRMWRRMSVGRAIKGKDLEFHMVKRCWKKRGRNVRSLVMMDSLLQFWIIELELDCFGSFGAKEFEKIWLR